MTLGARIKEERQRLGLNQTEFASIAGASRRAMVNWESDGAAPLVTALVDWAQAGADPLYIVTGQRTFDMPVSASAAIIAQLAETRRDILEPWRKAEPGESAAAAEERVMAMHANILSNLLHRETQLLPRELSFEIAFLLNLVTNPADLASHRAGELLARRLQRKRIRDQISSYLVMNDRRPGDEAVNQMVSIALDHEVPIGPLVDLAMELLGDAEEPVER